MAVEVDYLMDCDVLVLSDAGVKLYRRRLAETLPKLKRRHLVLVVLCQQVMSPASPVI